jgi:anti-sigma B factor antagonist
MTTDALQISIEPRPGYQLVRLSGELRAEQEQRITEELHPLIAESGAAMVLDLSQVGWVDSGGLSLLINLVTHSRLSQSRVILVNPGKFVAGVLEVTQLDKWFNIADNIEEAENKLK